MLRRRAAPGDLRVPLVAAQAAAYGKDEAVAAAKEDEGVSEEVLPDARRRTKRPAYLRSTNASELRGASDKLDKHLLGPCPTSSSKRRRRGSSFPFPEGCVEDSLEDLVEARKSAGKPK